MKGMRALCVLALLAGCRGNASAPPAAGSDDSASFLDFGENAAMVPTWSLPEERRAPKMPDAEKQWKQLGSTDVDKFNGLLICHVQIASKNDPDHWPWGSWHPPTVTQEKYERIQQGKEKNVGDWDTFNGPDALFRFRFAAQKAIQLYGPEDHWQMFISIPRLSFASGDPVRIDVWDRDVTSREFISTIEAKFDGHFPWSLEAKYLRFDCRGVEQARAEELARPWRDKLDGVLAKIEAAVPDPDKLDFGLPPDIDLLKSSLRWGNEVNFRYYAGYLGWDDPEVHARLLRFAAAEGAWHGKLQVKMQEIASASPLPGQWLDTGKGWSLRAARVKCDDGGQCVAVETKGGLPGCTSADYGRAGKLGALSVYWVTPDGGATLAYPKQLDAQGHPVACDGTAAQRYVLTVLPEHLALIRLQTDNDVGMFLRVR
jgi:hypothetical protein